jgi:hypothetical protein
MSVFVPVADWLMVIVALRGDRTASSMSFRSVWLNRILFVWLVI